MSSSDENFSEEDEDYVPEGDVGSEEEDENVDSNVCINNEEENTDLNNGKEEIDEIWKTFKSEVSGENKINQASSKEEGANQSQNSNSSKEMKDDRSSIKSKQDDTVLITQVYDFAGEEVKVTKEVKKDSQEAKNHFNQQSSNHPLKSGILGRTSIGGALKKRPGGGIGSVLGRLGKKPKLSTLEKSKLDWKQYKEEEGIEEELQAYNKGKEGYLEKVSFLKRTEMRQFEKERDLRLKQSSKR